MLRIVDVGHKLNNYSCNRLCLPRVIIFLLPAQRKDIFAIIIIIIIKQVSLLALTVAAYLQKGSLCYLVLNPQSRP